MIWLHIAAARGGYLMVQESAVEKVEVLSSSCGVHLNKREVERAAIVFARAAGMALIRVPEEKEGYAGIVFEHQEIGSTPDYPPKGGPNAG